MKEIIALASADNDIQLELRQDLVSKKITPDEFLERTEIWAQQFKEKMAEILKSKK